MTVRVLWVLGSDSDLPHVESGFEQLKSMGVPFDVRILSAHRTPDHVAELAAGARAAGVQVVIGVAGGAAHLAGVLAAATTLPVIGVPIDAGPLVGFDALLSTVQMPGGIPVATVAVGKAGARNAAYLAAQILGLSDIEIDTALRADRDANADKVARQNDALAEKLAER